MEQMSDKDIAAQEIVKRFALYAGGAGLIPLPVFDFAAITAIEIKMLRDLGNLYGVPFHEERVRAIVVSLIGAYTATKVGYTVGGSMMKSLPVIGQAIGMAAMPAFGAGVTYFIGKLFIQHFVSGGTFLDFDPRAVRARFSKSGAAA